MDKLQNVRTTLSGDVVILKRPNEMHFHSHNVSLTFAEYEFLVHNKVSRFEVLYPGRKSRKVDWDPKLLQYAQFHGVYYLVPYSTKSKLVRKGA